MSEPDVYEYARSAYLAIPRSVNSYLEELGIVPMRKPAGEVPGPPKGLYDRDAQDLGNLYDLYMEWYAFFVQIVTKLKAEVVARHEWRQYCLDNVFVDRGDIAKTDRAANTRVTLGYVEVNAELAEFEQKLMGVEAEMKRMSKHAVQVSRHITLRQDETQMGRRSTNVRGYAPKKINP